MAAMSTMGLFMLNDIGISGPAGIYVPHIQAGSTTARRRWRATNPVTRSTTRFTRNTTTETSATGGKHVPWSFKGPLVAAAAALVAGAIHYLTGITRESYPGSHIVRG